MPLSTRLGFADAPLVSAGDPSLGFTTLSAPLSNVATTATVTDPTNFPAAVQFPVILGLRGTDGLWTNLERALCTSLAGAVLTLTRPNPVDHVVGERVSLDLTAYGLMHNPGPRTDAGDLSYLGTDGLMTRLPAGATGTVVRYAGGLPTADALQAGDIPDLSASYTTPAAVAASYVPLARTVNGHSLAANVSVSAADVGLGSVENAAASGLYVPLTRTVNGHALSANVTVSAADLGISALVSQWTNDANYTTLAVVAGVGYLTSVTAHNLLSATHGDTLAGSVARGSLIVGNSTPKWTALAVGAANGLLSTDGTDVSWVTATGTGAPVRATTPTFVTNLTAPLIIGGTGTTSTLLLRSTSGVGAAGADIVFQVGNNGATEAARILNSGFVGINTAAPSTYLHIGGQNTNNSSLRVGNIEIQPYAVNNCWFGDNCFHSNALGFQRRAAGSAGLFYFQGTGGSFRFVSSSTALDPFSQGAGNNGVSVMYVGLDSVRLGGDAAANTETVRIVSSTGFMGVGTSVASVTPAAIVHIVKTTEQLRLGYDASNYVSATVSSVGSINWAAVGTNPSLTVTPGGTGQFVVAGPLAHTGTKAGFFSASAVVQQTRGGTLTNNVTSGGTTDQIDNFTDLSIYANDAAAIRNDIYQLARAVRQHDVALRALGLET